MPEGKLGGPHRTGRLTDDHLAEHLKGSPAEEPPGWRELQERAKSERDPRKLEAIIAEMNRLLTECEKRAGNGNVSRPTSRSGKAKPPKLSK
jgi:hypothetical protein